jgi:hypothetical protein
MGNVNADQLVAGVGGEGKEVCLDGRLLACSKHQGGTCNLHEQRPGRSSNVVDAPWLTMVMWMPLGSLPVMVTRYKLEEVCALEARGWTVVDVDLVVLTTDVAADLTRAAGAAGCTPPRPLPRCQWAALVDVLGMS